MSLPSSASLTCISRTITVSQRECHFDKFRLRDEDFEFSDLMGAAYEYLIKYFADSAGKKGGEFYTPSEVVNLITKLLRPEEGMEIYDGAAGSGGILIQMKPVSLLAANEGGILTRRNFEKISG